MQQASILFDLEEVQVEVVEGGHELLGMRENQGDDVHGLHKHKYTKHSLCLYRLMQVLRLERTVLM